MQNDIQDKLSSIPGVTSAAFGSAMPLEGYGPNLGVVNFGAIRTDDRPDSGSDTPPVRLFKYASPGFFRTAGTRLIAGREITWTEVYGLRPVVLISENLARELWGTPAAALGKRLRQDPGMPWHEVIGVVQDVHENALDQPAPAIVYWPTMSAFLNGTPERPSAIRGVTFIVRSERTGTEGFLNEVRQAVWSVNASLPVSPRTMREVYDQSLARTSFTLVMLAIAASMALLLGVVGIYGVISYTVVAATARDRHSRGARRAAGRAEEDVRAPRPRARRHRCRDWPRRGGGTDAADVVAVVRDHAARSRDLRRGAVGAGDRDGAGQLSARAARGVCGAGGSPADGVVSTFRWTSAWTSRAIRDIGAQTAAGAGSRNRRCRSVSAERRGIPAL